MKGLRIALITAFCVLLGYAPELSTYYVQLLNSGHLEIIEDRVEASPCELSTPESVCTYRYKIDLRDLRNRYKNLAIGTGQIIYSTRYKCGDGRIVKEYDDYRKPGKNFDTFNTYQTIQPDANCTSIYVEAWGHHLAVRKGKISGIFVAGELEAVERVKRVSEFFRADIYQVFSFCFLFLLLVSLYLRAALPDLVKDAIDHSLVWWILCAFSNAGLIQILFPSVVLPQWQNKFGAITILVCLVMTYFSSVRRLLPWKRTAEFLFVAVSSLLILNPNFAENFSLSLIIIAATGTIFSAARRDLFLFVLSAFVWSCALKIRWIFWLPNPMVIYFYVGIEAAARMLSRLRVTRNFSRFITYVTKLHASTSMTEECISDLVRMAQSVTSLPKVTLLRVHPDTRLEIQQHFDSTKTFLIDSVPPVFAHALSLRSELWHLDVSSASFSRIKKINNSGDTGQGKYVSVVPLHDEEKVYGALAVTGYGPEYTKTNEHSVEQMAIIRMLSDQIKSIVKAIDNGDRNEWTALLGEFYRILEADNGNESEAPTFSALADMVAGVLRASVFIAELDHESRKFQIHSICGFDPYVQERFQKGTVYARLDNEQGPIALAVNKKKPVIVSDVNLLRSVLHENSVLFFEKNETLSCAGIPIFRAGSAEVWGVLWLERRRSERAFNFLAEATLVGIAGAIGRVIDLEAMKKRVTTTTAALQEFVPEHVVGEVLSNRVTKQQDFGYIVMLDLKGSTKVALEKGSDFWLEAVAKMSPKLVQLGESFGLKLQHYKWDAFIFTHTAASQSKDHYERIYGFWCKASEVIEDWYCSEFSCLSEKSRELEQKARCCISFGDTSCGIMDGPVKAWGLVGAEVAAVTKLEDVCKKLPGVLFFDASAMCPAYEMEFLDTGTVVASTERRVFRHRINWFDTARSGTRNAA